MKGLKIFAGIASLCVTAPIWYFLVYTMLNAAHPDRLVWFLFWVYVPLAILLGILQVVISANEKSVVKKDPRV
jgi:hypothetical protein